MSIRHRTTHMKLVREYCGTLCPRKDSLARHIGRKHKTNKCIAKKQWNRNDCDSSYES